MRIATQTLGCKVSQYETEAIAERFEACGFRVVPFTDTADVYVINTCTVTAESDTAIELTPWWGIAKDPVIENGGSAPVAETTPSGE